MTLKTRFRVLGSTGGAMFLAMGDHGRSWADDKTGRRTECEDTINVWARPESQHQNKLRKKKSSPISITTSTIRDMDN